MTRASEFLSAPTRHPASLEAFRQEIDTAARRIADNAETAHDYASTAWASVLAAARSGRYAAKVQDDSMPRLIAYMKGIMQKLHQNELREAAMLRRHIQCVADALAASRKPRSFPFPESKPELSKPEAALLFLIANNTCKNGQPNLASVARKLKRNKSTVSRRLEKLRSRHEDVLEEWFVAMTSKLHQLTTETRTRLEDWILRRVDL